MAKTDPAASIPLFPIDFDPARFKYMTQVEKERLVARARKALRRLDRLEQQYGIKLIDTKYLIRLVEHDWDI